MERTVQAPDGRTLMVGAGAPHARPSGQVRALRPRRVAGQADPGRRFPPPRMVGACSEIQLVPFRASMTVRPDSLTSPTATASRAEALTPNSRRNRCDSDREECRARRSGSRDPHFHAADLLFWVRKHRVRSWPIQSAGVASDIEPVAKLLPDPG